MTDLLELFKATDTLLNIHLLNSTAELKFENLSLQLKPILGRCVGVNEIFQLLTVYPGCYRVTETAKGFYVINAPENHCKTFGQHVMRRRNEFTRRLENFNGSVPEAGAHVAGVCEAGAPIEDGKVLKRKSGSKVEAIKKYSSEFEFKESEPKRKKPLLERIREKERLKKEKNEPVESEVITDGLSLEFYDILYSSVYLNNPHSVIAFDRLLTILKDSSPRPMGVKECELVIERIANNLKDKVEIVQKKDKKYVKIANLDREKDLSVLGKGVVQKKL